MPVDEAKVACADGRRKGMDAKLRAAPLPAVGAKQVPPTSPYLSLMLAAYRGPREITAGDKRRTRRWTCHTIWSGWSRRATCLGFPCSHRGAVAIPEPKSKPFPPPMQAGTDGNEHWHDKGTQPSLHGTWAATRRICGHPGRVWHKSPSCPAPGSGTTGAFALLYTPWEPGLPCLRGWAKPRARKVEAAQRKNASASSTRPEIRAAGSERTILRKYPALARRARAGPADQKKKFSAAGALRPGADLANQAARTKERNRRCTSAARTQHPEGVGVTK